MGMLYHASRRTDIPARYWDWFANRVRAGYALVRNPYYPEKVSRYLLTPDVCDGFSFLSKNYEPTLENETLRMAEVIGTYRVTAFAFTYTPYPHLEPGLPSPQRRMRAMRSLSAVAGRERCSWFLAPLLAYGEAYDVRWHLDFLDATVPPMSQMCASCMADDVNVYDRVGRRAPRLRRLDEAERDEILGHLGDLARRYGMSLRRCPGAVSGWERYGFEGTPCASRELLGETNGVTIARGSREPCGCVSMRDLGAYAPCPNACLYCYAKPGEATGYDPTSEMLCDSLRGDELIQTARQASLCR